MNMGKDQPAFFRPLHGQCKVIDSLKQQFSEKKKKIWGFC